MFCGFRARPHSPLDGNSIAPGTYIAGKEPVLLADSDGLYCFFCIIVVYRNRSGDLALQCSPAFEGMFESLGLAAADR